MWIRIGDNGVHIREDELGRIWLEEKKSRGRGKSVWQIKSSDQLTEYERVLFSFTDLTKAQEALIRIIDALDERRGRLEI